MSIHPFMEKIIAARKAKGWSQWGLASRAGVNLSTVKYAESGRVRPHLDTLTLLAKALGYELALLPAGEAERFAPPPGHVGRPDGDVAPHGTYDAYRRHIILGEDPCPACDHAHRQELGGAA